MSLILRIPPEREELIEMAARKEEKTTSAFILEAIDEKLGKIRTREQMIRDLAGWLSHDEAEELRKSVAVFDHDFS
jgi:uncharacterized protein (DUF1778 family)